MEVFSPFERRVDDAVPGTAGSGEGDLEGERLPVGIEHDEYVLLAGSGFQLQGYAVRVFSVIGAAQMNPVPGCGEVRAAVNPPGVVPLVEHADLPGEAY